MMADKLGYFKDIEYKYVHELLDNIIMDNKDHSEALLDKELSGIHKKVHEWMVCSLINYYLSQKSHSYSSEKYNLFFEGESHILDCIPDDVIIEDIPSLLEELHIDYLNTKYSYKNQSLSRNKAKDNLVEKGAVYTQEEIADEIVKRALVNIERIKPSTFKCLDFATGTGRFYRQLVKYFRDQWNIEPAVSISKCIYAIDIDPVAVNICRLNALSLLNAITLSSLKAVKNKIICRNALVKEALHDFISQSISGDSFDRKFDVIVSNPPYLVLKPQKKMDDETISNINKLLKYFRSSNDYNYSIEGMLNLYQLSLEAMIGMLKPNGSMGIICPSTLFADISATKLRKYLLAKHCIDYIKFFSEDDTLFENVTQATCIFHLIKDNPTTNIEIERGEKHYYISIEDVKKLFSKNWEIPSIKKIEWVILRKLKNKPIIRESSFIRNKRGELDLTLFRQYITTTPTKYRLVRGNMLSENGIEDINHEYVSENFIKQKSKDYLLNDLGHKRLVCQQISNQSQKVRLKFLVCSESDILGNSCNYITVSENNLKQMMCLLNSAILNWRFKITSSNNHINNYEIDELPLVPIDQITDEMMEMTSKERDMSICRLYGLNKKEVDFIIKQHYENI